MKYFLPHLVLGTAYTHPFPKHVECLYIGMGCFWGAERLMWQQPNIYTTAVGYAGGHVNHPTYEQVCSGNTGHAEMVLVAYTGGDETCSYILRCFWEGHDPTQGMRQGNDVGSQYRSAIYTTTISQHQLAQSSKEYYESLLMQSRYGRITTEILQNIDFHYAETYHQQYLHTHPNGYCGLKGTGVLCGIT